MAAFATAARRAALPPRRLLRVAIVGLVLVQGFEAGFEFS